MVSVLSLCFAASPVLSTIQLASSTSHLQVCCPSTHSIELLLRVWLSSCGRHAALLRGHVRSHDEVGLEVPPRVHQSSTVQPANSDEGFALDVRDYAYVAQRFHRRRVYWHTAAADDCRDQVERCTKALPKAPTVADCHVPRAAVQGCTEYVSRLACSFAKSG